MNADMLRVHTRDPEGRPLLILGLSKHDTGQLKSKPIFLDAAEFGRIVIFTGTDEKILKRKLDTLLHSKAQALSSLLPAPNTPNTATPNPEGELRLQMGPSNDGTSVIMHFGKSVAWLGFGPDEAEAIGYALQQHAQNLRAAQASTEPQ